MPDAFAYDHEGRFLGMNAFIRTESIRLAEKFEQTTAQLAAATGKTPAEAHELALEFLAATRQGVRSFESYSLSEILDWASKRAETDGA